MRFRWHLLSPSIGATANVFQQRAEYVTTHYRITLRTTQFGEGIDQGADASTCVFRILRVPPVDSSVRKDAPHVELRRRVLLPEMRLERRELFGSSGSPDGVETPRAALGQVARAALEVLGLDLRVLAEREEDVEREVVVVGIDGRCLLDGDAADDHGERDGEVERIDGRFVDVRGPLAGLDIMSAAQHP